MASSEFNPLRRLTDSYPQACSDFACHGAPCIYKTGAVWPNLPSPIDSGFPWCHEARPVYNHPITAKWPRIGERIFKHLDFLQVLWSSINPLAYAHEEEAKPFCPLLISIGVTPHSLPYHEAYAAAHESKGILVEEGFPDVEVAIVESVVTRHSGTTSHFLPFTPSSCSLGVQNLVRPFTTLLGIPVALLERPDLAGTGGLVFHLGLKDTDSDKPVLGLLTCAHVALPPVVYGTQLQRGRAMDETSPSIEYIALGKAGYEQALHAMNESILNERRPIHGYPQNEGGEETRGRKRNLKISKLEALRTEIVDKCATLSQRLLGSLLCSVPLQASLLDRFASDWAMIAIGHVHQSKFTDNKIYMGDSLKRYDFQQLLYPYESAQDTNFNMYPPGGLLQVAGAVGEAEIRDPKTLDEHGELCLFVLKNGASTGTTVGRVNGMESFVRTSAGDEAITTKEIAVVGRSRPYHYYQNGVFSDEGDSGSAVVTRDGRIVGLLTGGMSRPIDSSPTDISYITPYWWIEPQIKEKFPDSYLYGPV